MGQRQKLRGAAGKCGLLVCISMLVVASNAKPQAVTGLDARRVASGLSQPLFVTAPPGDCDRLFIVCQTGQVHVLNLGTGALTLFIDLTSNPAFRDGGEQGLLGMAFDPNYATNGKFYLNFTVNSAPTDTFQEGVTHVSQLTLSAIPPYHADTSTERSCSRSSIRKLIIMAAGSVSVRAPGMKTIFTSRPVTAATRTTKTATLAITSPVAMRNGTKHC
jgi:hypothetical protein